MPYAVVAIYRIKPGAEEAVQTALEEMTTLTRQESGCRFYQPHRSLDDPQVFFLYEQYDDEAAFQAHVAADYFDRHIRKLVWPSLEERSRLIGAPIAARDA